MSSLWTPGGGEPENQPEPEGPPPSPEEVEALRELHARLVATPVTDVIANHALGLWQVALVHLGAVVPPDDGPPPVPDLAAAGLAIDAMACLVDGLGERMGDYEDPLRDALTQVQMLYVQIADESPN